MALTLTRNDDPHWPKSQLAGVRPGGLHGDVEAAAVFYNLRLYDRALATQGGGEPRWSRVVLWRWNGIVSGGKGDFVAAVAAFEQAIELGDTTAATRCYYVHALARAGRRADALRDLRALERESTVVAPSSSLSPTLGVAIASAQLRNSRRDTPRGAAPPVHRRRILSGRPEG